MDRETKYSLSKFILNFCFTFNIFSGDHLSKDFNVVWEKNSHPVSHIHEFNNKFNNKLDFSFIMQNETHRQNWQIPEIESLRLSILVTDEFGSIMPSLSVFSAPARQRRRGWPIPPFWALHHCFPCCSASQWKSLCACQVNNSVSLHASIALRSVLIYHNWHMAWHSNIKTCTHQLMFDILQMLLIHFFFIFHIKQAYLKG